LQGSTQNFTQQQGSNGFYTNGTSQQINKFGTNELFKSSIYGNNPNSMQGNNLMNDKAALNLSGGKPSNLTNTGNIGNNAGITPPRKMPRIS
jgi:hypothetical protein